MALDTRRYRSHNEYNAPVSISNSTLPGLIILFIGVFVIVTGIILLAAFGIPNNMHEDPEDISGVIVVLCGMGICIGGVLYTRKLKKRAKKRNSQGKKARDNRSREDVDNRNYWQTSSRNAREIDESSHPAQISSTVQAPVHTYTGQYHNGRNHFKNQSYYNQPHRSSPNGGELTHAYGQYGHVDAFPVETCTEANLYGAGYGNTYNTPVDP